MKTITVYNPWRPAFQLQITGKEPLGWLYCKFSQVNPKEKRGLYFLDPRFNDISNLSKNLAELGLVRNMYVSYLFYSMRIKVLTEEVFHTAQSLHDEYERTLQPIKISSQARVVLKLPN